MSGGYTVGLGVISESKARVRGTKMGTYKECPRCKRAFLSITGKETYCRFDDCSMERERDRKRNSKKVNRSNRKKEQDDRRQQEHGEAPSVADEQTGAGQPVGESGGDSP